MKIEGWIPGIAAGLAIPEVALACPFCNVDGPVIRWFLAFVVGPYILGAVMMLLWSVSSGHYDDAENPKFRMLELDEATGVRSDTLTRRDR